ncbi:MAG: hypothetical protein ACLP3K_05700 [Candidatus Acidiferrales bacterium]
MTDPLLTIVEEIRRSATSRGLTLFFGWLAEHEGPAVHWNEDHGGDWKAFLECASSLSAKVVYLNWAPFEQFQIDDPVAALEAELGEGGVSNDDTKTIKEKILQLRSFNEKVGLTCIIDLAFVVGGTVHLYQKTTDWYDEFSELLPDDDDEDQFAEEEKPLDSATVEKWARALAADPNYILRKGSSQHLELLKKIAGDEAEKISTYGVLNRAQAIFQDEFRQDAERKLVEEIRQLREDGLNVNAVAIKLGISKDRVSGLLSAHSSKQRPR